MQKLKTLIAQTQSDQRFPVSVHRHLSRNPCPRTSQSQQSLLKHPVQPLSERNLPIPPSLCNLAMSETQPNQSDQPGQSSVVPSFLVIHTCPPVSKTAPEKTGIQLFYSENRRETATSDDHEQRDSRRHPAPQRHLHTNSREAF